jgi:hypothetical protein
MKKLIVILLIILNSINSFGQKNEANGKTNVAEKIENDSLEKFVDKLKNEVLIDTLKFKKNDLIGLNGLTENAKSYSKIYLVDMKYIYKLDIISNEKVKEFVTEILNVEKIESISFSEKNTCCSLVGKIGINGCVFITTKKKSKINYKVGGLKYKSRKKGGSNLDQNKENGINIMIRT